MVVILPPHYPYNVDAKIRIHIDHPDIQPVFNHQIGWSYTVSLLYDDISFENQNWLYKGHFSVG